MSRIFSLFDLFFGSVVYIIALVEASTNDSISTTTGQAVSSPMVTPMRASSTCGACAYGFEIGGGPWASEIYTYTAALVEIVTDDSTNTTSTATIKSANFSAPSGVYGDATISGSVATETLGATLYLTYPTVYEVYFQYSASFQTISTISANGTSHVTCTNVYKSYTEAFAIPEASGSYVGTAVDARDAFTSSNFAGCENTGGFGIPTTKIAVNALTATTSRHVSTASKTPSEASASDTFGGLGPIIHTTTPYEDLNPVVLTTTDYNSIDTSSYSFFYPSGPVVHETVTGGLHPETTPTALPYPAIHTTVPYLQPAPNASDHSFVDSTVTDATESGPVVHETVTGGLHPEPTTTEEMIGIISSTNGGGNSHVNLPIFGPIRPNPTTQPSAGRTNALGEGGVSETSTRGSGSQPGVALPITQSQDEGQGGSASPSRETFTPPAQITVGGQTYTANPSSKFIVGSQTLEAGRPAITQDGHTISVDPSASIVIIDSSTAVINYPPVITFAPSAAPVLTINSHPITPNSASQYLVGGQTLIPGGPAVTVSGTRISLAPSASDIVVGSSTQPLGSVIMGAFGPITSSSSSRAANGNATTTSAEAFTGGAALGKRSDSWGAVIVGMAVGMGMVMG